MSLVDDALRLAETACEIGDWTGADRIFRQALDAGADSIEFQISYGAFLAERQKFHLSLQHLMHAHDLATSAGDLDAQAVVLAHLATICRQLGEFDLARSFQRQVLAIRQEAEAGDLLAWSTDALMANKTRLAESLAQTALSLAEETSDPGTAADCYGILGLIAARRGQPRAAISLLIQALRRHGSLGDAQALGTDYANLGEICGLIGRSRWQGAFFTAAWEWFERAGMPVSQQQMEQRSRASQLLQHHGTVPPAWN